MRKSEKIIYEPSLRASERIRDIREYEKHFRIDIQTDEILERGIHVFSLLKQINIKKQLKALQDSLDDLVENYSIEQLGYAKDLSKFIFSAMIVKRGVLSTEIFETVTQTLQMLYYTLSDEDVIKKLKKNNIDYISDLNKELLNISKSLDIWIDDK